LGITRVPLALHIRIWLIVLDIKCRGGKIQLLYFDQSYANASTPEVPGVKNLEKNLDTFLFLLSANVSQVNGPHNLLKKIKMFWEIPQSSKSNILLRKSASKFSSLGIHSTSNKILYDKHKWKICKLIFCNSGFILPVLTTCSSGHIFTKVVRVLVKYWRSLGFPIVIYLDDGLGTAENYELREKMSVQVRGVW
jgi:hypothetical protein